MSNTKEALVSKVHLHCSYTQPKLSFSSSLYKNKLKKISVIIYLKIIKKEKKSAWKLHIVFFVLACSSHRLAFSKVVFCALRRRTNAGICQKGCKEPEKDARDGHSDTCSIQDCRITGSI